MILDVSKEVASIKAAVASGSDMSIAAEIVSIQSAGMAAERERIIRLIQRNRNVINPMEVVAEIRRPLR